MSLVRRPLWFFLTILILPLLMYPAYMGITGILDYLLGDGVFARDALYGSRGELLRELLSNWIISIPPATGLFFLTLLPVWLLLRRFPKSFYFIALLGGALLGYYFFRGEVLSATAVAIAFLFTAMIADRVLRFSA